MPNGAAWQATFPLPKPPAAEQAVRMEFAEARKHQSYPVIGALVAGAGDGGGVALPRAPASEDPLGSLGRLAPLTTAIAQLPELVS